MNQLTKQFMEGYQDFKMGVQLDRCPYDSHSQPFLAKRWIQGWKSAKFDSKISS